MGHIKNKKPWNFAQSTMKCVSYDHYPQDDSKVIA